MAAKQKIAFCWLGACGGCDEAIVDLNEALVEVAGNVDIVFWPIAMDLKYSNIEKLKDKEIAMSIISGSVRNSEHKEMAYLLRKKSRLVMAFGACAGRGGTPGLANFTTRRDILDWVFKDAPTVVNPNGSYPQARIVVNGNELTLPDFFEHVYPLNQAIGVDYYLPGCPPPPDLIASAINAFLAGDLPPKGATIGPRRALCDTCPRNQRKPARIEIKQVFRIHEIEADPDMCFLEQGIICMGPVTRSGFGESCINVNIPCRGCFGPVPAVTDCGSRYLSTLASLLRADTDEDVLRIIDSILDPPGYFYRFTQPSSIPGTIQADQLAELTED
jgi:F420-non-reducing hydrogenase small subunit